MSKWIKSPFQKEATSIGRGAMAFQVSIDPWEYEYDDKIKSILKSDMSENDKIEQLKERVTDLLIDKALDTDELKEEKDVDISREDIKVDVSDLYTLIEEHEEDKELEEEEKKSSLKIRAYIKKEDDILDKYRAYILEQYKERYGEPKVEIEIGTDGRVYEHNPGGITYIQVGETFDEYQLTVENSFGCKAKEDELELTPHLKRRIKDHAENSIYRRNAPSADCYAFDFTTDGEWQGGWDWKDDLADKYAQWIYDLETNQFYKNPNRDLTNESSSKKESQNYKLWKTGDKIEYKGRLGKLLTDPVSKSRISRNWIEADIEWDGGIVSKNFMISIANLKNITRDSSIYEGNEFGDTE